MKAIAQGIRSTVEATAPRLAAMTAEAAAAKTNPEKWSKKQILGHLIDSAANNHQRFVRACYGAAAELPPYSQNDWVRIQHYQESDWAGLVTLWTAYNRHLCDLIERIPAEALAAPVGIGKPETVTLEFVIVDYLRHLRHHVEQLLG